MYKYINGFKKEAVFAPLFKMLEALLELFVPLVVSAIIDNGIGTGSSAYVFRMCALLASLGLAGLLFSVTAQYFAAKAAVGFSAALRSDLFGHVSSLSYPDIDRLGASTLITRLTGDVNQVQNGLNLTLRLLMRSPFVVFGAMIMAFTVDKVSAFTFVGTIPVLAVVISSVMLVSIKLHKTVQTGLDGVTGETKSALGGVRVIRAFGREADGVKRFERVNGVLTAAAEKAGNISALINPVTYVIINAALIILIKTGAVRASKGLLTSGEVVALYNYMGQILVELIKLADLIINITKSLASADRIKAVMSVKPSVVCPESGADPDKNAPAVEFDGVSFSYPGAGDRSLDGISFKIMQGEKIGIIGATGSGKTTLVNLIPRFYDPKEGTVKLFGNDVKSYSADTLSKLTAVVPQKAVLFRGTVKDNLLWGNKNAGDEEIVAALETAQARDITDGKKNGINAVTEEEGKNFSGGQKQRLTVARALLKKAPVLILDDSSSALDAATDAAMRKALASLEYSPAVITVSQRIASVKSCDRIFVTDDGRLVGTGTHERLLENCPVYREIYESQTGGEAI